VAVVAGDVGDREVGPWQGLELGEQTRLVRP
jgi:hypothetical protein